MLIFCRCCKNLCYESEVIKCSRLEIPKSEVTAENYHYCTEYEYHFRPERGNLIGLLIQEREAIK